ncbi:hypothetical protein M5K25_027730 [Dendrobium thyrsiflorum]|uniref:F-box domain-containing protein n=1 Tax=Dendrobium thyrsiflorum TaxID=117978 RepID=A0ABD0TUL8_DENTH
MDTNSDNFYNIPDHLLIEIFVRVPISEWVQISCVCKQWASIFRAECLWQFAIARSWPSAVLRKRWPGPIPGGLAKRRYMALYASEHVITLDGEVDELVGHAYLFLKEQLELSTMPPPSSILHGTLIATISGGIIHMRVAVNGQALFFIQADQFIACGRSRDNAYELASQIWLTVLNNLVENEHTFALLKRLALEGNFFLPYPYSRSDKVLWRVFEKLFTDFRDCFTPVDYYDALSMPKQGSSRYHPLGWVIKPPQQIAAEVYRGVSPIMAINLLLRSYPGFLGGKPQFKSFKDVLVGISNCPDLPNLKTFTHRGMPSLWIFEEELRALVAHFEFCFVGKVFGPSSIAQHD